MFWMYFLWIFSVRHGRKWMLFVGECPGIKLEHQSPSGWRQGKFQVCTAWRFHTNWEEMTGYQGLHPCINYFSWFTSLHLLIISLDCSIIKGPANPSRAAGMWFLDLQWPPLKVSTSLQSSVPVLMFKWVFVQRSVWHSIIVSYPFWWMSAEANNNITMQKEPPPYKKKYVYTFT